MDGTWGDNSRSARGAKGMQINFHILDPVQIQREVGRNPLQSRGQGGRAAPLGVPPELASQMEPGAPLSIHSTVTLSCAAFAHRSPVGGLGTDAAAPATNSSGARCNIIATLPRYKIPHQWCHIESNRSFKFQLPQLGTPSASLGCLIDENLH